MASKNGIDVTLRPVVCVRIVGRSKRGANGHVPFRREDDQLVSEFLQWQLKEEVHADLIAGGASGGGRYLGFFDPKDLDKIKAFFGKKGFHIK